MDRGSQSGLLRLLESAFASSSDGVLVVDSLGRLVYTNEAGRWILERISTPDASAGMDTRPSGLCSPDGKPIPVAHSPLGRAVIGETVDDLLASLDDSNGRPVWLSNSANPFRDAEGRIGGAIWVARDVTRHILREQANQEREVRLRLVQQAARESEERYRSLFENSPISLWEEDFSAVKARLDRLRRSGVTEFGSHFAQYPEEVVRCAGLVKIIDVNQATLGIFNATSKDQLIANLANVFGDEECYLVFAAELVALAEGRTRFEAEAVNRTLDGKRIEVNLNWQVMPGHEDDFAKVVVSVVDVSERKRAEARLRETEERLRVIFEQAAVGIGLSSIEGPFVRVNARLCEIVGYSSDELMQLTFADLTHEDERAASVELARRLLAGEIASYQVEKRYVRKDGSPVWVNVTVSIVRGAAREPKYFVGVVEDIERRKAIEFERERLSREQVAARERIEELAETAQRRATELESVLDTMVEAVAVVDSNRRIVLINGGFEQVSGLDAREIAGMDLAEAVEALQVTIRAGARKVLDQLPVARALAGQTVRNELASIRNAKTHREIPVRVSAAPLRGSRGEVVGAVAVATDVTELVELDRLKDQFIAVAAHELKTPIAIMKGYAQALQRSGNDLPEPRRRMLDAICRGAGRIDGIILDLLDISQLTAGRLELRRERLDLSELVTKAVNRLARRSPKHQITVGDVESVAICGDRRRLEQVLKSLLDNAVRYSPGGGDIAVSVAVQDGQAVVSVHDEGVGIPSEKQARIFQRFYRAHTGTPYDYGGMGVGLYISEEIVRRHGGRMWFESREGRGSTFTFSLPLLSRNRDAGDENP